MKQSCANSKNDDVRKYMLFAITVLFASAIRVLLYIRASAPGIARPAGNHFQSCNVRVPLRLTIADETAHSVIA